MRDGCCARCGSSTTWVACDFCGGEGVAGHDCGEDSCCCVAPEENVRCEPCGGRGGWLMCLADSAWCEANPLASAEAAPTNEAKETT
jgi:hypothetical protein